MADALDGSSGGNEPRGGTVGARVRGAGRRSRARTYSGAARLLGRREVDNRQRPAWGVPAGYPARAGVRLRGRHTTTRRMLVELPGGGALIDTPGLRELGLWAGEESVDEVFAGIAALARQCRFHDCAHAEEPGCAVTAALTAGELEPARWASYQKLLAEARYHERAVDRHAAAESKRKWKVIHKAMRHHPRYNP